jgi:hypothetical protein
MTMSIVAKLDELGRPAWIALMILAFFVYWPVALAILAFLVWRKHMRCWTFADVARWQGDSQKFAGAAHGQGSSQMSGGGTWWQPEPRSSGNRAFDDYRKDTLRRLEDEQREFHDFLARLRLAKDKAEFDQFMAERRNRPSPDSQPSA